jgi:predicted PurR-regulated permease PerM
VFALSLIMAFCYVASSLCITLLLAAFLAIVVDPLIMYFERLHISRMVSAAVVVLAGPVLIGSLAYMSYRQVSDVVDDLPQYARRMEEVIASLNKKIQKVQDSAGRLNSEVPTKKVPEVKIRGEYPEWTSYVICGVGPVSGALSLSASCRS